MKKVLALLGLAFLALAAPLAAAGPSFPALTGRVVDSAHILSPADVVDITSKSEALEAQSGAQLVVATVPSLDGLEPFDYGYKLIRHWRLGQKGKDDGVLILVAPTERKVFIATGYGARTRLTDAMAGVIVRNSILPEFKKRPPDYGSGISAGVDQVITQMRLPEAEAAKRAGAAESASRQAGQGGDDTMITILLFLFIFIFFIRPILFGRRGRGRGVRRGASGPVMVWGPGWGANSWGGTSGGLGGFSGGGGFGGFSGGGGSAGGGGAGGSW